MVKTLLQYFHRDVAIGDNEGNLSIHTAIAFLSRDDGSEIMRLWLANFTRKRVRLRIITGGL
jgi:HKD family nuclease